MRAPTTQYKQKLIIPSIAVIAGLTRNLLWLQRFSRLRLGGRNDYVWLHGKI